MNIPVPAVVGAVPEDGVGGVAVVPWPTGVATRARARVRGVPRLLVVAIGAAPPTDCELDEDWTSVTAPAADVAARLATLATRPGRDIPLAPAVVAAMSDVEVAVFDALEQRRPAAVPSDVLAAVAGSGDELDGVLTALRVGLEPTPYELVRVPGGALLATSP